MHSYNSNGTTARFIFIRDNITQTYQRSFTSDQCLHTEPNKGNHGKTTILDFVNSASGTVLVQGVIRERVQESGSASLLPSLIAFQLKEADDGEHDGGQHLGVSPIFGK